MGWPSNLRVRLYNWVYTHYTIHSNWGLAHSISLLLSCLFWIQVVQINIRQAASLEASNTTNTNTVKVTVVTFCFNLRPLISLMDYSPKSKRSTRWCICMVSDLTVGTSNVHSTSTVLPFRGARTEQWPHGAVLQEQLWDYTEDFLTTTS